jgi:hypothetical protein
MPSTPLPGMVQYGDCPGFVRLISNSRPRSSIKIARTTRLSTVTDHVLLGIGLLTTDWIRPRPLAAQAAIRS